MKLISYAAYTLLISLFILTFTACDDDDVPPEENEEETITDVTLTFTPAGGGSPAVATWVDRDGEGANDPVLTDDLTLAANTTYTLRIEMINAIDPDDPESISEEVEEEDEEHQFFFGWTDGLFTDPEGDGNIGADQQDDPLNYEDEDDDGNPLGLETRWTTGDATEGTFRLLLKHQPDIKSATSGSEDGETDVDVEWNLVVR